MSLQEIEDYILKEYLLSCSSDKNYTNEIKYKLQVSNPSNNSVNYNFIIDNTQVYLIIVDDNTLIFSTIIDSDIRIDIINSIDNIGIDYSHIIYDGSLIDLNKDFVYIIYNTENLQDTFNVIDKILEKY